MGGKGAWRREGRRRYMRLPPPGTCPGASTDRISGLAYEGECGQSAAALQVHLYYTICALSDGRTTLAHSTAHDTCSQYGARHLLTVRRTTLAHSTAHDTCSQYGARHLLT